ncbi:MAG: Jag N-terminal domain-containing protein [Ruminococcus sp.]|nr:Jag N-terminal domain-containing protein [Ruminococcus sp.]
MTEVFKAPTVDEAKAKAAKKFGKDIKNIKFEVLEEGSKGFFGIGKKEAVVKAVYEAPAAAPAAPAAPKPAAAPVKKAEPAAEKKKVPAVKPEPEVKKEVLAVKPEPEVNKEVPAAPVEVIKEEAPAAAEEKASEAPEKKEASAEEEDFFSLDSFSLIEDEALVNPKVKLAKDYITSVLGAMDIEVSFKVYQNETGAVIEIESSNNGTVIGRRGETLDAIQYLCSIIANKGDKDYYRITIDCLGYRSKRRETLEQLAAKVAKSVLRTGRSQPLEPMNPYERRVIHSSISKIEGVSSKSVGEEPYRRIIVSSNNPKNNRRRDNRRDGGRNDRRNDRRNKDREVTMERKSVNLETSFEKDYKRPKPEDSIEGGLYGKIEF